MWIDRRGKMLGELGVHGRDIDPAVSPDGTRIAVSRFDAVTHTRNLWLLDPQHDNASRLTFGQSWDVAPTWAPDSTRLIYASRAKAGPVAEIYEQALNGSDTGRPLNDIHGVPEDWSSHGQLIIYSYEGDLWLAPERGTPKRLFQTPADERQGQLSPDGKWIAYASDESGRYEVFVRSFPVGSRIWQISIGGGVDPKWRHDGRELFISQPIELMAGQSIYSSSLKRPLVYS